MLRSQRVKPTLLKKRGNELSLTAPDLTNLLLDVLEKGLPFRFRAKGSSMSPFIKNGDVITVVPLSECPPRLGDVVPIIHTRTGDLVVHRIIGKSRNSFLIKGDNATKMDGLFPKTDILGAVKIVERNGKRVFIGLGPERVMIAFMTRTGILFPIFYPLWKLMRPIFRLP